jgi:hypothetical protein
LVGKGVPLESETFPSEQDKKEINITKLYFKNWNNFIANGTSLH